MSAKVKWPCKFPDRWSVLPSKRLFPESKDRAPESDEQLSATQEYGVISQAEFMRLAGRRVVQLNQNLELRKRVEIGDFVISMRSFQGGLERAWAEGGIRSSYVVLRPRADLVPGYYQRLFKSVDYIQALQSTANFIRDGQDMNYQNFVLIDLPFPPVSEQFCIAAFLDHETARIDALIEEQQRLIELLKEKRQALISQAVTKGLDPKVPMKNSGVEWLGEVPADWVVLAIKWRARIKSGDGISPDLIESYAQEDKPHPVIGGNGVMGFTSQANVSPPLIVIGRVGALCGNVHKILNPAWVSDNALILDFDRRSFDINYLVHVLDARNLNEISDKSAQPLITGSKVTSQYIPCPGPHEQLAISKFLEGALSEFDQLVLEGIKGIELLKERRSALISAAVTGKIDLRGWQLPAIAPTPELELEAV